MPAKTLINSGQDCAPPLTAKLAPWMERLIKSESTAQQWLNSYGSPVHIVVTSEFRRNIQDLLSPMRQRGLAGGLYFARKANKLPWFISVAKEEGIGIDTASLQELQETIEIGIDPKLIISTAIGKSYELVSTAIAHGCLLVIDNHDELQLAKSIAQTLGKSARIGIRLSGFDVGGRTVHSRFGFPIGDWDALTREIFQDNLLNLELLHAHLDRYDVAERACAARQLIALADSAAAAQRKITSIDLGGGILIRYLQQADQWDTFLNYLVESVAGHRPTFTYQADGLGYHKVGQEVHGKADLYPVWNNLSKERFIAAILDDTANGVPLHKDISNRGLQLFFEPGRALLDNVGVTLSTITFRKRDTSNNLLIGAAMNRTNLRPFRAEFCSDPILLANGPRQLTSEGAFLVGNLCSESDLLFRRKIQLDYLPIPGDLLLFANTAGYLAHHLEIGTHGGALPINMMIDANTLKIEQTTC